jgi:hypothetical protein
MQNRGVSCRVGRKIHIVLTQNGDFGQRNASYTGWNVLRLFFTIIMVLWFDSEIETEIAATVDKAIVDASRATLP